MTTVDVHSTQQVHFSTHTPCAQPIRVEIKLFPFSVSCKYSSILSIARLAVGASSPSRLPPPTHSLLYDVPSPLTQGVSISVRIWIRCVLVLAPSRCASRAWNCRALRDRVFDLIAGVRGEWWREVNWGRKGGESGGVFGMGAEKVGAVTNIKTLLQVNSLTIL